MMLLVYLSAGGESVEVAKDITRKATALLHELVEEC
jgi:hypothetical protein